MMQIGIYPSWKVTDQTSSLPREPGGRRHVNNTAEEKKYCTQHAIGVNLRHRAEGEKGGVCSDLRYKRLSPR